MEGMEGIPGTEGVLGEETGAAAMREGLTVAARIEKARTGLRMLKDKL